MTAEFFQFAAVAGGFLTVAVAWLFIVYLPGRTLEDWSDKRPKKNKRGGKSSKLP